METIWINLKILLAVLLAIDAVSSLSVPKASQNHIFRQYEEVAEGKYKVRWDVEFDTNNITFEIEVETTGYIGFGISPTGGMMGADIVIGGVNEDGPYFEDRHGVGQSLPPVDTSQDYDLITASENGTHTYLKFSRLIDTCDTEDVAITADTQKLIWSIGATDDLAHHGFPNRGVISVNFLDPPMPPVDTSKYDKWALERNMVMPSAHTSYWCTIHKSPDTYTTERHVVGFNTRLDGPDSLAHTHHLNVYKCTAPPGVDADELFGPLVGGPGGECYAPVQVIPSDYCRTMLYVWAVGGKPMFFPDNVGYPITEGGSAEYLMFEIHYNNPEEKEGVQFTSAVEIFSSPILREESAAVLISSHSVSFSHLIPPGASEFLTVSHCGPACTGRTIDQAGIKFTNVLLHGHLLGRKMRLRHFRENTELPWIAVDDHYDFDFQQNRPLREETLVLPGDQLTMECTTDSTAKTGITIGGLSTTAEMCQGIIWYYPRGELMFCESAYDEWDIMQRFGVENIDWTNIMEPPIVTAPEQFAGKSFIDVVNEITKWTPELIAELQKELSFTQHYEVSCGLTPIPEEPRVYNASRKTPKMNLIGYPEVDREFAPIEQCLPVSSEPPVPESSEPSIPESSEPSVPESSEPSVPESSETSVPESSEPSAPESSEPSVPESSEPSVPESSEPSVPESSEPSVPESSEPSVPESSEPSVPETSEFPEPESTSKRPSNIGESCSSNEECDGFGQDCGGLPDKLFCRCSQYYKEVNKECKPRSGAPCEKDEDCQNGELYCAAGKCDCKGDLIEIEDGTCKAGSQNVLASTIIIAVAFVAVQFCSL